MKIYVWMYENIVNIRFIVKQRCMMLIGGVMINPVWDGTSDTRHMTALILKKWFSAIEGDYINMVKAW